MSLLCNSSKKGFALIEVLIAVTILSVVLLSVYSGMSTGINIVSNSRNYTIAMTAARSLMNEFRSNNMRGPDMRDAPIPGYPDFSYDRVTTRFDNPIFGPLIVNKTVITVRWKYKSSTNTLSLSYIYQAR